VGEKGISCGPWPVHPRKRLPAGRTNSSPTVSSAPRVRRPSRSVTRTPPAVHDSLRPPQCPLGVSGTGRMVPGIHGAGLTDPAREIRTEPGGLSETNFGSDRSPLSPGGTDPWHGSVARPLLPRSPPQASGPAGVREPRLPAPRSPHDVEALPTSFPKPGSPMSDSHSSLVRPFAELGSDDLGEVGGKERLPGGDDPDPSGLRGPGPRRVCHHLPRLPTIPGGE
jgi:hypothetical protein